MKSQHLFTVGIALLCLAAVPAAAELSEQYAEWAEGPVGFLLTEDEQDEWKTITDDAEAQRFIELFWARRNPNPTSPVNEFKARFESMVAYADREFSYEGTRGALSDRGKVMLLLGPPHQAEKRFNTETVSGVASATGQSGRGSDEVRARANLWVYEPSKLDDKFKAKGSRLLFTFYEERPNTNQFYLDRSHREATMALRAMRRAPEVYLLHPDLTRVPRPVSVPGGTEATDAQLAALGSAGTHNDALTTLVDLGASDASGHPIWIHLGLPTDAPVLDTLAGRVLTAAGDVASTFQIPANRLGAGTEQAYHLTFPLVPGSYELQVAGFSSGEPAVTFETPVEVPEIGDEGVWASDLWVGLQAMENPTALLGAAYTFGGWHLVPLTASDVPKTAELSYFGMVARPEVAEGAEPTAKLKLTLKKDGKRLGSPLRMDLILVKVRDDLYFYANAITLAALPPGECTLDFDVTVPGLEEKVSRTVELNIVE
jgi:GWxTD domain-containing protein